MLQFNASFALLDCGDRKTLIKSSLVAKTFWDLTRWRSIGPRNPVLWAAHRGCLQSAAAKDNVLVVFRLSSSCCVDNMFVMVKRQRFRLVVKRQHPPAVFRTRRAVLLEERNRNAHLNPLHLRGRKTYCLKRRGALLFLFSSCSTC